MARFTVILTRDITESTVVTVEAESAEAAHDVAHAQVFNSEDGAKWEIDDGSEDEAYVTGVSETDA